MYPADLPITPGGFQTVLADPPWRFTNRTGKIAPEHKRLGRYATMDLDEICALSVERIVAENAHLYLWVPNALVPEGLEVMSAWGFRYVSNIVWAKRRKDGGPDGRGVGFYFRNTTELILFGVRGRLRTLSPARSQVNIIESRKREHSRKPEEQYELIEKCSPGPRVELFARYRRAGWTVWGDEADDGVTPKGRAYKGYEGGRLLLPYMQPHQRMTPEAESEMSGLLASRYLAGDSIRKLASDTGFSISRVRRLLVIGGVELRPRGAQIQVNANIEKESA